MHIDQRVMEVMGASEVCRLVAVLSNTGREKEVIMRPWVNFRHILIFSGEFAK